MVSSPDEKSASFFFSSSVGAARSAHLDNARYHASTPTNESVYGKEKKEKWQSRGGGKRRGQWVSVTEHCGSREYGGLRGKLNITAAIVDTKFSVFQIFLRSFPPRVDSGCIAVNAQNALLVVDSLHRSGRIGREFGPQKRKIIYVGIRLFRTLSF